MYCVSVFDCICIQSHFSLLGLRCGCDCGSCHGMLHVLRCPTPCLAARFIRLVCLPCHAMPCHAFRDTVDPEVRQGPVILFGVPRPTSWCFPVLRWHFSHPDVEEQHGRDKRAKQGLWARFPWHRPFSFHPSPLVSPLFSLTSPHMACRSLSHSHALVRTDTAMY